MTTSFDSAISHLTNRMNSRGDGSEREELQQVIRVLEDWPRWEPLIKAAGQMLPEDKTWLQHRVDRIEEYAPMRGAGYVCPGRSRKDRWCALLESLPDKE